MVFPWKKSRAGLLSLCMAPLVVGAFASAQATAGPTSKATAPEVLREFVVLPKVGVYGRAPFHVDAIDAAFVRGDWKMPAHGDMVVAPDGRSVKWRSATANEAGMLATRTLLGGYAATRFHSPRSGVFLLEATGHAVVYVNGEPHAGDPYALGGYPLPVLLRKGENVFVFHVAQPQLQARLVRPEAEVVLFSDQATLPSIVPSIVQGEEGKTHSEKRWGAIPLVNASGEPLQGATIVAHAKGGESVETPIAWLDSASMRKVPFQFLAPSDPKNLQLEIQIVRREEKLATTTLSLESVRASDLQVRTFRSRIDRSVQSYVLLPAQGNEAGKPPGLLLALHGAGVSAREFASHFQPKSWAHLLVPEGRGRYGFDWEDWARDDAIEAMNDLARHYPIDDRRQYVTGHAMGAHGALVLAATEPNRFAAVGTSAAWASLSTYGGGMPAPSNPTPVQEILGRSAASSDTLRFLDNLQQAGVYLLHGAADEVVPVKQSRLILAELSKSHDDFAFQEKPQAGNWWGKTTVDSPEMMDFFQARQRRATPPSRISFSTTDLGLSASSHWVTIAGQEQPFVLSRAELDRTDSPLSITGTTENISRLSIDKSAVPANRPFFVRLDGSPPMRFRAMPASGQVWMAKEGDRWHRVLAPKTTNKGPARYGGFKSVFRKDCLLVFGTRGDDEENAWSRAKARFDAETFAYRGNGALEILPDTEFDAAADRDRNVVLYGNFDTNRACPALLSTSPVRMFRNRIEMGKRPVTGNALGFLVVRPRPGSDTALVGVVGGTGVQGMRLTNRLRYFVSGVAYPDLVVFGPQMLERGDRDVRAAGFFSEAWTTNKADIVWRDMAL